MDHGWHEVGVVETLFVTEPKDPPPGPIHVGVYQPGEGPAMVALRMVGAGNLGVHGARRLATLLWEASNRIVEERAAKAARG